MSNAGVQNCDLCQVNIFPGQKYGVLVFNIETFHQTPRNPKRIITVHHSENANVMCINCASKFNGETIKQLID